MKRKLVKIMVAIGLIGSMVLAGCGGSSSSSSSAAASKSETKTESTSSASSAASKSESTSSASSAATGEVTYADIEAPAGKVLRSLPVDKVADEEIRIATICVQNNPWGAAVVVGQNFAKDTLADFNCKVDVISVSSFDAMEWTSAVENCIASAYDAICFMAISDELQPAVEQAEAAGIAVFLFNCDLPDTARVSFYGMDDIQAGNVAGQAIADLMPDGGKYAIITGDFSVTGHENRRKGCHEITDAQSNLECVGEYENDDDADKAYSLTTDILNANPDVKAIYVTAGGPGGAAQALIDAKRDDVMLICHDVLDSVSDYIADGTIDICIDQDPFNQGYQPVVDAFNYLVAGVQPAEEVHTYEAIVATPDNVKEIFPELF